MWLVALPPLLLLLSTFGTAAGRQLHTASDGSDNCREDTHGRLNFRGALACDLAVQGLDAALGSATGGLDGRYVPVGCHSDWPMYHMAATDGTVRILWRSSLSQEWRFDNVVAGFSQESPGSLPQTVTKWEVLESSVDPFNPMPAQEREAKLSVQCLAEARPQATVQATMPASPDTHLAVDGTVQQHSEGMAAHSATSPPSVAQPPAAAKPDHHQAPGTTPRSVGHHQGGSSVHNVAGGVSATWATGKASPASVDPVTEKSELRMGAELAIIFLFVTMLMSVSFSGAMFAICNGLPMSRRDGWGWRPLKSYDAFDRVDYEDDYSVLPAGTKQNTYLLC
mmetsp:Transcript_29390/g.82883  ORF Transcript_29390/g.82883 Transcript_29390/m.82883 type:complete len:338 (-) Transcript_29390:66-1079(-)